MDIPPVKSRRQPNAPSSPTILPDELVTEVLSFLNVKSLMRLRCVSKSWNSLMFNPTFVKMHLKQSSRNAHLTLLWSSSRHVQFKFFTDCTVVSFSVRRLLDTTRLFDIIDDDPYYRLKYTDCKYVIGSCNGMLCLLGYHRTSDYCQKTWLRFWNPSTRTISKKLGFFLDYNSSFKLAFGYDNLTATYKVVVSLSGRSEVSVFSLGDNVWRNIQSFPVVPLRIRFTHPNDSDGVYLKGTLNWLAIRDKFEYDRKDIAVGQFVIVSLDLHTETYTQFLPPQGFDEVPYVEPIVRVLMDCLCFSHDFKGTHFVIWQMTEFGVEESWTQFLKISYQDFRFDYYIRGLMKYHHFDLFLYPLCLSENGDTLILACNLLDGGILYNLRDKRVERVGVSDQIWWFSAKDYVESLVSTC